MSESMKCSTRSLTSLGATWSTKWNYGKSSTVVLPCSSSSSLGFIFEAEIIILCTISKYLNLPDETYTYT